MYVSIPAYDASSSSSAAAATTTAGGAAGVPGSEGGSELLADALVAGLGAMELEEDVDADVLSGLTSLWMSLDDEEDEDIATTQVGGAAGLG